MLGIVTIDPNTCTLCTMCTQTCPTGALAGGYADNGELMNSFDPVDGPLAINASGCDGTPGKSRVASSDRGRPSGPTDQDRAAEGR